MKVLLYGKFLKNVEELIKKLGFQLVNSNPDTVISYGGDGTLLSTERRFPSIPKFPIRNSLVYTKCKQHEDELMLKKFLSGKYKLKEYRKLVTTIFYKNFYALNDFVIRNSTTTHSIRFKTSETKNKLLIGDGIVVATSLGSTAYFKSITNKSFNKNLPTDRQDFGLAFNNTTEKLPPFLLKEDDQITFNLKRGKATLSFDNNPDIFALDEGSELIFALSDQKAKIFDTGALRCSKCKLLTD